MNPGLLSSSSAQTHVHIKHKANKEQVKANEANGLPQINLGAQIHIEEEESGDEVEHDVPDERGRVEGEGRGVDGDEPDDEGGDEGTGGEDGAEAGAVVAAADGGEGGEDVRGAVAEGEEGDGGDGGGEVEGDDEPGGDEGEVVLRGFDEEVEEEEEEEGEGDERECTVVVVIIGGGGEEGAAGDCGGRGGVVWGV